MIENFKKNSLGQILVEKVKRTETKNYGIVDLDKKYLRNINSKPIKGFIEKPSIDKSPSNYRIIGRYLLPDEIFSYLKKIKIGKDGEIQLTDALQFLIKDNPNYFRACLSQSNIYDCGSKKGFIGANIAMSLKDKDMEKYIREILN